MLVIAVSYKSFDDKISFFFSEALLIFIVIVVKLTITSACSMLLNLTGIELKNDVKIGHSLILRISAMAGQDLQGISIIMPKCRKLNASKFRTSENRCW
jgi:hypothetical protein